MVTLRYAPCQMLSGFTTQSPSFQRNRLASSACPSGLSASRGSERDDGRLPRRAPTSPYEGVSALASAASAPWRRAVPGPGASVVDVVEEPAAAKVAAMPTADAWQVQEGERLPVRRDAKTTRSEGPRRWGLGAGPGRGRAERGCRKQGEVDRWVTDSDLGAPGGALSGAPVSAACVRWLRALNGLGSKPLSPP